MTENLPMEKPSTQMVGKDESTQAIQSFLTVEAISHKIKMLKELVDSLFVDGIHYTKMFSAMKKKKDEKKGKDQAAGKDKDLLLDGANLIKQLFQLRSEYPYNEQKIIELPGGKIEYRSKCYLYSMVTGEKISEGEGIADTGESKWRYNWENTEAKVPKEYWENMRDPKYLGGDSYTARSTPDGWYIFLKVERTDPADIKNTAMKISRKRALMMAIKEGTIAGECFNVDLEDVVDEAAPQSPGNNGTTEPAKKKYSEKPPTASKGNGKIDIPALKDKLCEYVGGGEKYVISEISKTIKGIASLNDITEANAVEVQSWLASFMGA